MARAAKNGFGTWLQAERKREGLSQADLDGAIDKTASSSFTAQVESGRFKPPDRDTCEKIAKKLKLPAAEVWDRAAPVRIRMFDPELERWHTAQMGARSDWPDYGLIITNDEASVVVALREVFETRSAVICQHLMRAIRSLGERATEEVPVSARRRTDDQHDFAAHVRPSDAFAMVFDRMRHRPPAAHHRLWTMVLSAVNFAELTSSRKG